MRLVIIGPDSSVGVNGEFIAKLDLSGCGLPANFWALQWNERGDNTGHIEYNSSLIENTPITEIPAWANACIAVWQTALDEINAEKAARLAEKEVQEGN
jgi:hypothetical protein